MKILVVHDREGTISTLVTAPAEAPMPGYAGSQPGQLVSEVELPELSFDPTSEESHEQIIRLLDEYRVDFSREARLVPKGTQEK
jgi:hypothetical protein